MAAESSRQEIAALYVRYGPIVSRRCRFLLRDAEAAEDAMQEVFVKVMRAIEQFRGEASPLGWILKIATNHCLNVIAARDAAWRERYAAAHRVERAGTERFPSNNGQKLYGELVMEVWVNRQGRIVDAIVTRSSGNKLLDKRARGIVMAMGQFDPVPPEVSAGHDLLLISSRFRFTRDAGLEATTVQSTTSATSATPNAPPMSPTPPAP